MVSARPASSSIAAPHALDGDNIQERVAEKLEAWANKNRDRKTDTLPFSAVGPFLKLTSIERSAQPNEKPPIKKE